MPWLLSQGSIMKIKKRLAMKNGIIVLTVAVIILSVANLELPATPIPKRFVI